MGYAVATGVRESSRENKLESDVASINNAVQLYRSSGGTNNLGTDISAIIARLKTRADSASASRTIGMKDNFLDMRVEPVYQTTAEAATSQLRAVWNSSQQIFVTARAGGVGVKEFRLNPALAAEAPETEVRTASLEGATATRWVWDYTAPTNAAVASVLSPTAGSDSGGAMADAINQNFFGGTWQVGPTGTVTTTYLYDGAGYRGQLGFFSLKDMGPDRYDLRTQAGLNAFMLEAVRRIIADQNSGRVVLDARANNSSTTTTYTHQFEAGDTIAAILIPNNTFAAALTELSRTTPNRSSTSYPLLSLSFPNEDYEGFYRSQAISLGNDAYAIEDIPGGGDQDYEDLIWKAEGLTQPSWSTMREVDPNTYYRNHTYWSRAPTGSAANNISPYSIQDALRAGGIIQ